MLRRKTARRPGLSQAWVGLAASGASAVRAEEARLPAFATWAADDRWGDVPQRPE